eukprot:scaffold75219_cov31-Phaeocystis_antarctica.AAC.1
MPSANGPRRSVQTWVGSVPSYIFCDAWRPPPSVGRPSRTTTERQGVVDGALGSANDAGDGSAAQTPAGVAARDGQEGLGTTPSGDDCGLAAGLIEAELAAGERIFGVLDANNRRVRRNSPMMSNGTSSCRTRRGGQLGGRAAAARWGLEPRKYIGWPSATLTWPRQYGVKDKAHNLTPTANIQRHCHIEHRPYPKLLNSQSSHS